MSCDLVKHLRDCKTCQDVITRFVEATVEELLPDSEGDEEWEPLLDSEEEDEEPDSKESKNLASSSEFKTSR